MTHHPFRSLLAQHETVLGDGGLGVEVAVRGSYNLDTENGGWSAPPLFLHEGQAIIRDIHTESILAGAQFVTTDSFSTPAMGILSREANATACRLAQEARVEARIPGIVIAGSAGPIGNCYDPNATPSYRELVVKHAARAEDLLEGGADIFWAETIPTELEALVALYEARAAGFKEVAINFYGARDGKGLPEDAEGDISGSSFEQVIDAIEREGLAPAVIGVNCVDPEVGTKAVTHIIQATDRPVSVYTQGPHDPTHPPKHTPGANPETYFIEQALRCQELGARVIKGCCGVNVQDIGKLREALDVPVPQLAQAA